MTCGAETWTFTIGLIRRLKVILKSSAIERPMLGISMRNRIRNEEIRRRAKVLNIAIFSKGDHEPVDEAYPSEFNNFIILMESN